MNRSFIYKIIIIFLLLAAGVSDIHGETVEEWYLPSDALGISYQFHGPSPWMSPPSGYEDARLAFQEVAIRNATSFPIGEGDVELLLGLHYRLLYLSYHSWPAT